MRTHVHALRHTLCCLTFLRLGSGTFGSPTELQPQQPTGVQQSSPFRLQRQQPTGAQQSSLAKLRNLAYALPVVGTLLLVSLMHRPFGGHHDRWRQPERKLGGKVPPPAWSPEWSHYPFRKWLKEFNLWLNMTEYSASQTATALVQTLQGTARLMCDEYPMQQLTHGRLNPITGEHTDPVSMILEDLAHRFAPRLEEDQKLVDHELESFPRFPNEKFEAMLYRYHYLVARQREEGLQMFSWRHHAIRVLKYCGLSGHSMHDVLLSLNNQIPDSQATYEALLEDLKRRTRLVEYSSVNPYVLILSLIHI